MSDRPINFSAPMVRASLAGSKTQTRRVLKLRGHRAFSEFGPSDTKGYDWHFRDAEKRWHDHRAAGLSNLLPYVHGDRLWVREAHYLTDDGDNETAVYAEDACEVQKHINQIAQMQIGGGLSDDWATPHLRLRPSIHMPRWASRLTLTVTDVRVQRLHDINRGDAMAEGCPFANMADGLNPRGWYADIWDTIHGPFAWKANPWVVAVSFNVQRGNIDAVKS